MSAPWGSNSLIFNFVSFKGKSLLQYESILSFKSRPLLVGLLSPLGGSKHEVTKLFPIVQMKGKHGGILVNL